MVDRYTKAVLTVIALALICLVAGNLVRPLNAQSSGIQRVVICNAENTNQCAALWPFRDNAGREHYGLQVLVQNPSR
jgi:hypothetical protein